MADYKILLRTHSHGYKKRQIFLFLKKVTSIRGDKNQTIYKVDKIQKFYRKIKYDLSNFRGVQNGYHQCFQYLIISFHFFHEVAVLM